jgi:hypothetical protein
MKGSLTGLIASQAYSHVREAKAARDEKAIDREVSNCVMAQLLLALTVEGVANEVAEVLFPKWPKDRVQSADAAFKWWFLSAHNNRIPFDQSAEPLQTVVELLRLRNHIAHPKVHDFGDELIVQDSQGNLQRNVPGTQLLKPGDKLASPTVQLMEDHKYNYEKTYELLTRTISAVIKFRDHVGVTILKWAPQLEFFTTHLNDS